MEYDFGKWVEYTDSTVEQIEAQLGGEARIEVDDQGMDNHLLIHLKNGKTLVIRYDWIYEWQVIDQNAEMLTGSS